MARTRHNDLRTGVPRAVIGFVHPGDVRAEFATSLVALALQGRTRIDNVIALESGPNISTARNKIVREFLDNHRAPWLLMIDTDMVWSATALDRLIAANKPVIGGLCYSYADGEVQPTMYELVPEGERYGFKRPDSWLEGSVLRVTATGAAFLLVHRDVLAAMPESTKDVSAPWFRETPVGSPLAMMGEDMTFCLRLAAMEIPVHVHTGVQIGHMKFTMLGKVI